MNYLCETYLVLQATDAGAEREREVRVHVRYTAADTAARPRILHAADEVYHGADGPGGDRSQTSADQLGVGCGQARLAATHLRYPLLVNYLREKTDLITCRIFFVFVFSAFSCHQ